MGDEDLVWAVKAVDKASPALARVAGSMSKLHHSAFQTRDELGKFQKSPVQKTLAGWKKGLSAMWAGLGVFRSVLSKVTGAVWKFVKVMWRAYVGMVKFIAAAAAIAGAMALGGLIVATKQAGDFELASAKVQGVTGATRKEMSALDDTMRQLAKTSIFTAGQFYEAGYYLASAGFSPAQIRDSISGVTKLSEALGADLASSTATVVSTLSAFSMKSKESTRVANVFAASNAVSQANMEKLSFAMRYTAPVAGALKIRFEETAAALNILFNAGLRGMTAGTGLRMMMIKLISPTGQSAAILEKLGLTMKDIDPRTRGLAGAMAALSAANITTADAARFFGSETLTAFEVLRAAGGPAIAQMERMITGTQQAFTQSAIQMDTMANRVKYLISSLQELALVFGTPLTGPLKELLKYVADFINWLGETREIRAFAEIIRRVFVRIAGNVKRTLAGVQSNWTATWTAIWGVISRVALAIAAVIGGMSAAVEYMVGKYPEYRDQIGAAWEKIAIFHANAAGFIVRVLATIEGVMQKTGESDVWMQLAKVVFAMAKSIMLSTTAMAKEFVDNVTRILLAAMVLFAALALWWPGFADIAMRLAPMTLAAGALNVALAQMEETLRAMTFDTFGQDLQNATDAMGNAAIGAGAWKDVWNDPATIGAGEEMRQAVGDILGVKISDDSGQKAGSNFMGGFAKAMRKGVGTGRSSMGQLLASFGQGMSSAIGQLASGAVSGEFTTMQQEIASLSPEAREALEKLTGVVEQLVGPMAKLGDKQEVASWALDALGYAIDKQRAAMDANTAAIEKWLRAQLAQFTGKHMEAWAIRQVAETAFRQMHPATIARLVPGSENMTQARVMRQIMRNPQYMREVRNKASMMTYGERADAAAQAFKRWGQQTVDTAKAVYGWKLKELEVAQHVWQQGADLLDRQMSSAEKRSRLEKAIMAAAQVRAKLQGEGATQAAAQVKAFQEVLMQQWVKSGVRKSPETAAGTLPQTYYQHHGTGGGAQFTQREIEILNGRPVPQLPGPGSNYSKNIAPLRRAVEGGGSRADVYHATNTLTQTSARVGAGGYTSARGGYLGSDNARAAWAADNMRVTSRNPVATNLGTAPPMGLGIQEPGVFDLTVNVKVQHANATADEIANAVADAVGTEISSFKEDAKVFSGAAGLTP